MKICTGNYCNKQHAILKMESLQHCLVFLFFTTFLIGGAFAGCREGGLYGDSLCCDGKDVNCRTDGYVIGTGQYGKCYCDAACVDINDCCWDYQTACPSVDCEMSEWSYWSGCSVQCGIGVQERRRQKIRDPVNAGEKCGETQELKACFSNYCDENEIHGNGVAMILPHYYQERREDPDLNLMTNFLNLDLPQYGDYCVYFKVTNMHKTGCSSNGINTWPETIRKGVITCVQCSYPANGDGGKCYGEGQQSKKSRWTAVDVPRCRGRWKQQSIVKDCTCNTNTGLDFIFI